MTDGRAGESLDVGRLARHVRDHERLSPMDASPEPRGLLRGTPAFRRASFALFLAGFSTFAVLYTVQPLLPIFAREFGVSSAESSLPLSLSTAFLAAAILCAAALSENLGRRGLMFVSMAAASVLTIAAAVAPSWTMLLALRAITGFVMGGVPAVAMTYLAEESDPRGLGFAMGLYVGGTAFGGMIGRVGTGIVTEFFGWRVAVAGVGVFCLVAAIGFLVLLPPSRNFRPRKGFEPAFHWKAWTDHMRDPALPMLFAISFLIMGAFITIYNYAGFRLMAPPYELNQSDLGLLFLVYVFGIVSSSMAGSMADRLGRHVVLPIGLAVMATGIGLTTLSGLPLILLGISVLTIGFFFTHSVASGWVGRVASRAKGHASSLYLLAYYLGASIAGSIGGLFWDWAAWPGVIGFALALLALASCAAWRLSFVTRRDGV